MTPCLASQRSSVLRVLHCLIFFEALYCSFVLGIACSLGEEVPAALHVLMRVALLEEGWRAAGLLCLCLIYIAVCSSPPKHSDHFPRHAKNCSALVATHYGEVTS